METSQWEDLCWFCSTGFNEDVLPQEVNGKKLHPTCVPLYQASAQMKVGPLPTIIARKCPRCGPTHPLV